MKYRKKGNPTKHYPSGTDIRLCPERRMCNKFDPVSVAEFPVSEDVPQPNRIVDNCAEEHIM